MLPIRIKACSESDLRMLGNLAHNIQRVLPVTQADIDAAAALGKSWVVWKVIEVRDPLDNLRGGTQLVIKQNSITPGQNVRRVLIVQGPGGQTVVIRGSDYIVLPDAIADSLSYVKAFGGTEQNGTPTPTVPVDIVSNNGVLKYSKNLLDMATENIVLGKYINNSGVISDSAPNFYNSKYISVVAGETYTWSTSGSIKYLSIMEYDSSKTFVKRTLFGSSQTEAGTSGTLTLGSTTTYVLLGSNMFAGSDAITLDDILAVDWQFEKGSSATAYKPYGQIYTDGTVETINVHGKNLFNQATATRYKTSWSAAGTIAQEIVDSNAQTYGFSVKPNTTYTIQKKNGNRLMIGGFTSVKVPTSQSLTADFQIQMTTTDMNSYTFTTPADCVWILFSVRNNTSYPETYPLATDIQIELGSSATTYEPYFDGGTATAEMLLKVGDYQDVQSIIDGVVTRNVGVKVLDGTESNFEYVIGRFSFLLEDDFALPNTCICTHYVGVSSDTTVAQMTDMQIKCGYTGFPNKVYLKDSRFTSATAMQQYLADQYAAGTPVIVIYPLATETTESVAGQTLQVTDGDNVLEITQASLNGLELEAQYQASVSLTIQEVQDANLDPNVEVTIN